VKELRELVGGTGGLGWVAVKAVLMFAVAVIGLRLGERRTLGVHPGHEERRHRGDTR
jgi:hypothetical protein